jgi:DNA-binding NarL/FixJ family response regulator
MAAHVDNDPLRVLVVDDHELFRIGLRQLLEEEGLEVRDAGTVDEALRRLPSLAPDIVVLGVNLRTGPVFEATRRVREAAPGTAVLVLALLADNEQVVEAVRAGAVGYLLKDAELPQIVAGIRTAASGQAMLCPQAAGALIDHVRTGAERESPAPAPEPHHLSARERQVLALLASGCDNSQIGDRLYVSRSTVKNHVSRLLEKLEVENRVQAATYAIRTGLIDVEMHSN